MRSIIKPSKITGTIRAPQSKSYAIRYIMASTIAPIELKDLALSLDVLAAIEAVKALNISNEGNRFYRSGSLRIVKDYIYLGGSATTLRMFIPIAAVVGGRVIVDGDVTLRRRPITAIVNALSSKGIKFSSNYLPTIIEGKLKDAYIEIYGSESSQYISGLMVAFAILGGGTIKIVPPIVSRNYIYLTSEVLRSIGVNVHIYSNRIDVEISENPRGYIGEVPGDYLLASFYVASALLTNGQITVYNLPPPVHEYGDHVIVSIYRNMGAYSQYIDGSWHAKASDEYKPIEIDVEDSPDLALSIVPIASVANGITRINGVKRLKIKESNRIIETINMLNNFGIKVSVDNNALDIVGGIPREAQIICPDDHRIAMMVAPIALRVGGILDKAECVNKSNPWFWIDLIKLGGAITLEE